MAEEDQKTVAQSQAGSESTVSESTTIDQARRFLANENVRGQSRAKKTEFLKTKGLPDEEIEKLLSEENKTETVPTSSTLASSSPAPESTPEPEKSTAREQPTIPQAASPTSPTPPASSTVDVPPIVTYPEFLTQSPRPPPLITPSRLVDILAVSGTAWSLLYGAARFVVSPMVENLTEARSDYYTHVNEKLSHVVEKLEDLVSEVPYKNGQSLWQPAAYTDADDQSSYDDPTELFHRDIGTQTSPPPVAAPFAGASDSAESTVDTQARQLARLSSMVNELSGMHTKRAEDSSDLHDEVRRIRDEVDKIAYPPGVEPPSLYGYPRLGRSSQQDDDEYKKTKDAIRSVKGLFLSAKMFPTVAAR